MAIIQASSGNTASQVVPGLNVLLQQVGVALNGAPTNTIGVVGGASWGQVNTPIVFSGTSDGGAAFGPVTNRVYDLMTHVSVAALQGCQSFIGVRVTDGSDTAAIWYYGGSAPGAPIFITGRYSGVLGNGMQISMASSGANWTLTLAIPSIGAVESYTVALTGTTTAAYTAFWQALVAAVNSGLGLARPASAIGIATLGQSATIAPVAFIAQYAAGGTDGASGLTAAMVVGTDGLTRTGMYALRRQPISILDLVDMTDWTQASTVNALSVTEGWYAPIGGPAGQAVSAAASAAPAAGYGVKLLLGDWLYWTDQVNGVTRLVNPAAFAAGELATLPPNQSSLNKPLTGIVGSQRAGQAFTGQSATYSAAEKQVLFLAGVDLIANPAPGGAYWAVQRGINASGAAATNGDNHTRMTNFLCTTLSGGMGQYVGQPITTTLFGNVRATISGALSNMLGQGYLDATYGPAYAVVCDASNNPQARTSLGYLQADVEVRFEGIVLFLNVNLAAGQTVTVTTTSGS